MTAGNGCESARDAEHCNEGRRLFTKLDSKYKSNCFPTLDTKTEMVASRDSISRRRWGRFHASKRFLLILTNVSAALQHCSCLVMDDAIHSYYVVLPALSIPSRWSPQF